MDLKPFMRQAMYAASHTATIIFKRVHCDMNGGVWRVVGISLNVVGNIMRVKPPFPFVLRTSIF